MWFALAWGGARALVVRESLERADALAVMSGSALYGERTRLAARLFREGRAPVVILTNDGLRGGWSQAEERNPFFVERAELELRRGGVPPESIEVVPGTVGGTYAETVALRDYAAARGLQSLLVVTSGYHSRRALWSLRRAFQGSGISVGLEPVEPGEETPAPTLWWLQPSGWPTVAGEYAKLLSYQWRY